MLAQQRRGRAGDMILFPDALPRKKRGQIDRPHQNFKGHEPHERRPRQIVVLLQTAHQRRTRAIVIAMVTQDHREQFVMMLTRRMAVTMVGTSFRTRFMTSMIIMPMMVVMVMAVRRLVAMVMMAIVGVL